jgi:uncharacterized membrane protein
LKRVVLDFSGVYLALVVVLVLAQIFFSFDLGNGANIGALMGGVFFAGGRYGAREGAPPLSGFSWKVAVALTASAWVISGAVSAVLILAADGVSDLMNVLDALRFELGVGGIALIVAFVVALYVLAVRFTFPFAAKMQIKALEKQAQKSKDG